MFWDLNRDAFSSYTSLVGFKSLGDESPWDLQAHFPAVRGQIRREMKMYTFPDETASGVFSVGKWWLFLKNPDDPYYSLETEMELNTGH